MTFLALLLSIFSVQASAAAISAERIGIAAAVRGPVRATTVGEAAAGHVIETGKPVFSKDRVVTGADSRLQILLRDETTFTLGPNSDMILDEFVFDPTTNAGKVSAKMAKGAFRFVTGKVARRDPDSMKVATPVGTIGIRGTMVAGKVDSEEASIVLIGPGLGNNAGENPGGMSVGNEKGSTNVDRSGFGVTVKKGEAPSGPVVFTGAQLDSIFGGGFPQTRKARARTRRPAAAPLTSRRAKTRPKETATPSWRSPSSTRPSPTRPNSPRRSPATPGASSSTAPPSGRTSAPFRPAPAPSAAPGLTTVRTAPAPFPYPWR